MHEYNVRLIFFPGQPLFELELRKLFSVPCHETGSDGSVRLHC
jgi:hypothetical protein